MRLPNRFYTTLALLTDASNTHLGQEIDWQLYRHDQFDDISLLSAFAIQFQNQNLASYYFATTSYQPSQAKVVELEFIASYPIGDWGIFVGSRNYLYSTEITHSPITDSAFISQLFIGAGYKF